MSIFIGNCFISISSVLVVTLLATKVSDQSAYHSKICMYFILCIPPILSFYWPTYLIGENACSWKHEMNENNLFVLYPCRCYGMYFLLLVLCTRSKWFPPFHEWTYFYSALVRDFNWRVHDLAISRKNQTKKSECNTRSENCRVRAPAAPNWWVQLHPSHPF